MTSLAAIAPQARALFFLVALFLSGGATQAAECSSYIPPPVSELKTVSFYGDARSSIVSKARMSQYSSDIARLNDFSFHVSKSANDFMEGDECAGLNALALLREWSKSNALNKLDGFQANVAAMFMGIPAVVAYAKVSTLCHESDCVVIQQWLLRLARRSSIYFSSPNRPRNNLYYWSSTFSILAGKYAHDPRLFEYGKDGVIRGFSSLGRSGFSLENERGQRAQTYNRFAFTALSWGAAAVSKEFMVDLYRQNPEVKAFLDGHRSQSEISIDVLHPSKSRQVEASSTWRLPWDILLLSEQSCATMSSKERYRILGLDTPKLLTVLWELEPCT
ncbi:alginate lyase family protein [Luteimonas sp. S4-F44]|uniref:alginate lyase family protein n=1 Tax=Luteimonas sp. S4-F44 TaxID=2925842 RepID=UPI001F532E18|nr:alginate lyase family protein [Luteimonas sp. S4-F44]UNK42224.1 alginate lyase family protein [Luteimonas sp. S4-F44]